MGHSVCLVTLENNVCRFDIDADMNESQALGVTELKMGISGSPKPSAHSHAGK